MMDNLKDIKCEADHKTELQEIVQAEHKKVEYLTVNVGDIHQPYFSSVVSIDGIKCGEGNGKSKKEAEKMAAKVALANLVK